MSKDNKLIAKALSTMTLAQIERYLNNVDKLEKVLYAPPTADEVCKALSEFMGEEVVYESTSFLNKGSYAEVCALGNLNGVYFLTHLPPRLITMIGRFYEGLEK